MVRPVTHIRGVRDSGATEILVVDSHGKQAVISHLMEPVPNYLSSPRRPARLCGSDATCAGIEWVGQHLMMGTPDGVLHHT
jgi:D-amino peptidase